MKALKFFYIEVTTRLHRRKVRAIMSIMMGVKVTLTQYTTQSFTL